ncbi:MAG: hypothetical protein HY645_14230 [Acidobacteria bacterium]|nr:hypothetical protein [Acidobacteriota bacterium]
MLFWLGVGILTLGLAVLSAVTLVYKLEGRAYTWIFRFGLAAFLLGVALTIISV